jgi:hypothetical protein
MLVKIVERISWSEQGVRHNMQHQLEEDDRADADLRKELERYAERRWAPSRTGNETNEEKRRRILE